LQIYGNQDKLLPDPAMQADFLVILECLLQKSLYLLDCDKPMIGSPLAEFLIYWVQAHAKLPELDPNVLLKMQQTLQLVIKRIAFPKWCTLSMEPDERESEYATYRQELITLYLNLTMNKTFHGQVLTQIYSLLEHVDIRSTLVQEAEVPLLLVFNLI
jgi:hypothetical protein